jgi:P-type conjugative transfer protein TrbJ
MELIMRRLIKAFRLVTWCLCVSVAVASPPATAQVVTCANCGTEFTQLANNLQLADQLARQVELVQQALKRHETMLLNTTGLEKQLFGDPLAELGQVTALLEQATSLSITSADLDGKFAEKYKDYNAYLADKLDSEVLGAKYQQWSEDTNSSVLTTLKAANLQARQIEGDEATLFSALQGLSETAGGRMQAIQVANQIALAAARQTQKLRQLMLIQLQLQANFIQREADRQAAEEAAYRNFVTSGRDAVRTGDGKGF